MSDWKPLLQIIHVSDLHCCSNYDDKQKLIRQRAYLRLRARELAERFDLGGWHEGTLGHDSVALERFEQFLVGLADSEKEWFGSKTGAQTWLIDTGDATTFGDEHSLHEALGYLRRWQKILHNCPARFLFGNHDAWPGGQPGVNGYSKLDKDQQRRLLEECPEWRPEAWRDPLAITAHLGPRIECYGLNTVSFGFLHNTLALGKVAKKDLTDLRAIIGCQSSQRAYRILMTHHPVTFPYEERDIRIGGVVPKMELRNAKRVRDSLSECRPSNDGIHQPYVHLFLSGHTHASFPATRLPSNVKGIYMPGLGAGQLQLVAGSLMQIRDRTRARIDAESLPGDHEDRTYKSVDDFSLRSVCDANQQFQILRFYYRENDYSTLQLQRLVFVRVPSDPTYRLREAILSESRLIC